MRIDRIAPAAALAVVFLALLLPDVSQAIPVFARKYGFNCTMCHSNYPRLNDYGTRYRDNGYQLPGRIQDERTVLATPPPVALRTSGGYTSDRFVHVTDAVRTEQFMMNGLDLLSAGLLGRNLGYLLVYPPQVAASRGVEGQDGALEMANVVISNIYSPWLNARVGRFEPAYCAFSAKRQLTVSPYEIYDYTFPQGLPFSDTQTGIEVSGHGRLGSKYAAGVADGSATNRPGDGPSDAYLRVSHTFMPGDGQTMGQRLGLVGYMGRARSGFDGGCGCRKNFTRFGADVSLNLAHFNLGAQFLMVQDDAKLWSLIEKSDAKYSGGFAELSCLPMTSLVGFARYDWVKTPDFVKQDITRITLGGRFYFVDNLALHLEYSHRGEKVPGSKDDAVEDFVTSRFDYAF
jgi:hypothetical protein